MPLTCLSERHYRDATVLADAAMRGIIRCGTPARARIRVSNSGAESFAVETGRTLLDSSGLLWRIETPASVPPGGEAFFEARQVRAQTLAHTVSGSEPFYAIPIPAADDDAHLCGVAVRDVQGDYDYRNRYTNTLPDERVFHIEADDRQQIYVRFGYAGVVGVQPQDGAEISLSLSYTHGEISPAYGSPFAFEYLGSPAEAAIEMKMDGLLVAGQNPMPMSVLRDLAKYPSVYDDNAVFLGEFEFLVRRKFPDLPFLSVWNETVEEQARGPSLDNINTLFVACLSAEGGEAVLSEGDGSPARIAEDALTETQRAIRAAILSADDSYRVSFYPPVRSKIGMRIHARVSTSYVESDVRQQIIEALLAEFGESAAAARKGNNRPLYVAVYELLRRRIAALSSGNADLSVSIDDPPELAERPEMWRFVAPDSLVVEVSTANIITPAWGV
ncbi:MAG: hypothetical protein LBL69_03220 [Zoogloeaceae bacterium]|jgi:hypothetical protein|nr:hypothetical protein [Zoogloeaceae bacterium]